MAKRLAPLAAVAASTLLAPCVAHAAWLKAETDQFVIYGDDKPEVLRSYALKLTTYDAALRLTNPPRADAPPPQKVPVYLVHSNREMREIFPKITPWIAGLYVPHPNAVFAVAETDAGMSADEVLFHEYAHHYMLQNFPAAYPGWFVEGWADYYGPTVVNDKGVTIGGYDRMRATWLFNAKWAPLEDILSKRFDQVAPQERGIYYPMAWILMHYMMDTPERQKQLDQASRAIAAGQDPVKSMEAATGMSIADLTKQLKAYRHLQVTTYPLDVFKVSQQVTVTALPASADKLLLADLRLKLADPKRPDAQLLEFVRAQAAKYPGDRLAELVLARAEFTFGDVAKAEAIVKSRIDADPKDAETQLLAGKGEILAGNRYPAERTRRYEAARPYLARAHALNENDYKPLAAYAVARSVEPDYPTENDINVLLEARALAPAVEETSIHAGEALVQRGRKAEAMAVLTPAANNPHGGKESARARALMAGKSPAEALALAEAAEPAARPSQAGAKPNPPKADSASAAAPAKPQGASDSEEAGRPGAEKDAQAKP